EDLVDEAGLGELLRPDRAAEAVRTLQHADAPAGPGEQCRRHERVDAAADDDRVVARHYGATRSSAATARRASSAGSRSQSESAKRSPKTPLSEKISTSHHPS